MKLLVLCALVAVAGVVLAAQQNVQDVQLLRYYSYNDGLGTYSFGYNQSDGSNRDEKGELRNPGAENEFVAVTGSFSWISPDGVMYEISYIADDKGYHPTIKPSTYAIRGIAPGGSRFTSRLIR